MAPIRRSANGITTAALLLSIQLAGQPRNVGGQRIDGDIRKELLNEGFAARPPFRCISTVDAVNEFNDTDTGRNRDTRIEDQSHAGGVSGSRWSAAATPFKPFCSE